MRRTTNLSFLLIYSYSFQSAIDYAPLYFSNLYFVWYQLIRHSAKVSDSTRISTFSEKKPLLTKMVCISCIVIPALLYVWHRWLQPIVQPILEKYWYGKTAVTSRARNKDETSDDIKHASEDTKEANSSTGLQCPFSTKVRLSNVNYLLNVDL